MLVWFFALGVLLGSACGNLVCPARSGVTVQQNGTLSFSALPPITAGDSIQDSYNGGGLSGWYSMSRGFTAAVQANDITIEKIYNTTVGGGSVSVQSLLGSVAKLFIGIIAVTALGFVLAVAFLVVGGIFWCCRCCGNCGGERRQDDKDHMGLLTMVSVILLLLFTSLVLAGAVLSFFSNELFYDSYTGFTNTAIDSLEVAKQYGIETGSQLDALFCQFNDTSTIGQQEIDSLVVSLNTIINKAVSPILPRVETVGQSVNIVKDALVAINSSAAILKSSSQTLNMTIVQLNNNITSIRTQLNCGTQPCSMVPAANFSTVANFNSLPDISEQVKNISNALTNVTLQQSIVNVIASIQTAINGNATDIQSSIRNITNKVLQLQNDVNSTLNNLVNKPSNATTCSDITSINGIQKCVTYAATFISPVNKYVYGVGIAICSLALVTVVLVCVGVVMGVAGYERFIRPHERSSLSNCGGIFLLIAVGVTFLFGFFLLALAAIAFLFSSFMLVACDGLESPHYSLLTQLQPLTNLPINISLTDLLHQCQDDAGIYKVLNLDSKFNLSKELDIQSQIPNFYDTLESAANSINFSNQSVLLESATNALKSFSNAGISSINYTAFEEQANASIVSFNATALISELQLLRSSVVNHPNASTVIPIINGTIEGLMYLTGSLLHDMQQQVGILATNVLTAQNLAAASVYNASSLLNDAGQTLDHFANYSVPEINSVAGCRPVSKVYGGIYSNLCERFLGGLIEFWWSLGFCTLFFPAVIISAVITSRFFLRMKYDDPNDIEYMMKPTLKK